MIIEQLEIEAKEYVKDNFSVESAMKMLGKDFDFSK